MTMLQPSYSDPYFKTEIIQGHYFYWRLLFLTTCH